VNYFVGLETLYRNRPQMRHMQSKAERRKG